MWAAHSRRVLPEQRPELREPAPEPWRRAIARPAPLRTTSRERGFYDTAWAILPGMPTRAALLETTAVPERFMPAKPHWRGLEGATICGTCCGRSQPARCGTGQNAVRCCLQRTDF